MVCYYFIYSSLTFNFLLTRRRDNNKNSEKRYDETEFEIEIDNFIISGSNLFQTVTDTYPVSENIRHKIE